MPYQGPIIDADVHHNWPTEADVVAYLPADVRDLIPPVPTMEHTHPAITAFWGTRGTNKRIDTYPTDGTAPGSSYELMRDQLLDPFNVEAAVCSFDVGANVAVPNLYLGQAFARAINDWNIDRWLSVADARLCSAVLVSTQVPDEGAEEIRRVGDHPKLVEVRIVANGLGKPFGHPSYHALYDAAVEYGLPVSIHNGGDQIKGTTHMHAGGLPSSRLEYHHVAPQSTIRHLMSLLTFGVFEKFPDIRFAIVEAGVAWLPWLAWKLDAMFPILREESPWVKRPPSEYIREHIKLTTQPMEASPKTNQMIEAFEAFEGMDDLLMFGSDYPHWDTDDARYIARRIPRSWWDKVFYENGRSFYRWPTRTMHPAGSGGAIDTGRMA